MKHTTYKCDVCGNDMKQPFHFTGITFMWNTAKPPMIRSYRTLWLDVSKDPVKANAVPDFCSEDCVVKFLAQVFAQREATNKDGAEMGLIEVTNR